MRLLTVLTGLTVSLAGCQGPRETVRPAPTVGTVTKSLPTVTPGRINLGTATLPAIDLATAAVLPADAVYKSLDEATAQCLAAANSTTANLLDAENARPAGTGHTPHRGGGCQADTLTAELRRFFALEARNKAAWDALERYLQLADVTARTQLARDGLTVFDAVRKLAPQWRAEGLPAPEADELLRQRALLLKDLAAADAGLALLNHDLSSRLGVELKANEMFWPAGPFDVVTDLPDEAAAVALALQNRAELQGLRLLANNLNADTLPLLREQLKQSSGLLGSVPTPPKFLNLNKLCGNSNDAAELALRRQQVQELLASKETEATAQVRQALHQMRAATAKTALLQARTASLREKWSALQKRDMDKQSDPRLDTLTAQLDLMKAEADTIAAAVEWHQWRIRLKAAQGLLAAECLSEKSPAP